MMVTAPHLQNFSGFETGGLEQTQSCSGTPSLSTSVVRSGTYSLRLAGASSESCYILGSIAGTSGADGDDRIVGFGFYKTGNPSVSAMDVFTAFNSTASDYAFIVKLETSGRLGLYNTSGSSVATGSTVLSNSQWYFLEIRWENQASGAFDLHVSGVPEISTTGDFSMSGFNKYEWSSDIDYVYIDDFYHFSQGTGVGDFLGSAEVFAYQNTAEDDTDIGDSLDQGTWADAGDTPGSDEATPAGYTKNPSEQGGVTTDEGARPGPNGDSRVDGFLNIKGGLWVFRLQSSSGTATDHYLGYGQDDYGLTWQAVTPSEGSWSNHFILSDSVSLVPDQLDYFVMGIWKDGGKRALYVADMWAMLLHVPDESMLAKARLEMCNEASDCTNEANWSAVSGSEVTTTITDDDDWVRKRSGSITLTSGRIYRVAVASASSSQQAIASAKLILEQTDAGGLTDIELVHQYINSKVSESGASYVAQDFDNLYDANNLDGGTFTCYFEATLRNNSGTANARLTPDSLGNVTGTASYSRSRSSGVTLTDDATYDTEIANADVSSSWLIIQVSNLQIPESILFVMPLVLLMPCIVRWWVGNRRIAERAP
jgi:hypothetical protein